MQYNASYVRWVATTYEKRNGTSTIRNYAMQPCSETDFQKFYPAESESTGNKVRTLQDS